VGRQEAESHCSQRRGGRHARGFDGRDNACQRADEDRAPDASGLRKVLDDAIATRDELTAELEAVKAELADGAGGGSDPSASPSPSAK
jgi:hypothetical protein